MAKRRITQRKGVVTPARKRRIMKKAAYFRERGESASKALKHAWRVG